MFCVFAVFATPSCFSLNFAQFLYLPKQGEIADTRTSAVRCTYVRWLIHVRAFDFEAYFRRV